MAESAEKGLVIVGAGGFAQVAAEYFEMDGGLKVAAFAVERDYLTQDELRGKPVVALDEMPDHYPAASHCFFAAMTYQDMNRQRRRLCDSVAALGYEPASYISPRAVIARSASLGSHCFVMENNVVQPLAVIEDNVVLWSGNHVGHHVRIRRDCFVSSHVVVAGHSDVGRGCFLGVNATIADNITVGAECWLGPGAVITADLPPGSLCRIKPTPASKVSTWRFFGIDE